MEGSHRGFSYQPGTTLGTLLSAQTVKYKIKSLELVNTTGTIANVTLHLVRSGNTAGALSQIVPNTPIPANDVKLLNDVGTIEIGDTIQGLQGTSGSISVHLELVEVV